MRETRAASSSHESRRFTLSSHSKTMASSLPRCHSRFSAKFSLASGKKRQSLMCAAVSMTRAPLSPRISAKSHIASQNTSGASTDQACRAGKSGSERPARASLKRRNRSISLACAISGEGRQMISFSCGARFGSVVVVMLACPWRASFDESRARHPDRVKPFRPGRRPPISRSSTPARRSRRRGPRCPRRRASARRGSSCRSCARRTCSR